MLLFFIYVEIRGSELTIVFGLAIHFLQCKIVPCGRDLCSRLFSFSLWSVFGFYPVVAIFYVCVELAFYLFSVMFLLLFNYFL
jgi:hypothetical protein